MATNGSFYGTTSNSAIKPKITWSATENIAGNYSDVTATLSYSRTDSYKTYGYWAGSLTVGGDQTSVSSKYIEITKNSNTVAITHTVQVPHNDDGTKTITISASGGISGTTLTQTAISGTVTLTSIPRAASIAATDADIGSVSMVTIGKKSDSYTYTVAYQFGSLSGYLSESGPVTEAGFITASSLAFPLPESFYYEIPAKASDICTLTCTTYLNGSAIGDPQTCTFMVRADPARCAPVLSVSAEDTNSATLALTGDKNTFIRYASAAKCTMTVQTRFGASVSKRKIAGKTVSGSTLTLTKVETDAVTFAVTDSRGYTAEKTLSLELLPYFTPTLRIAAARTDATSGAAQLQVSGSFYHGDFGLTANTLQLQYQVGSGEAVSVQPQIDGNQFTLQLQLQDLDYTRAYSVSVTVTDSMNTQTATTRINPGIPVFQWGKEDFSFHVPVSMSGSKLTDLAAPAASGDAVNLGYVQQHYLKNAGNQVLSGNLSVKQSLMIDATDTDIVPRVIFRDASGITNCQMRIVAGTNRIYFYEYSPDGAGSFERYMLPAPDNRTDNVSYNILTGKTHGMACVWENASPTSSFEAQTLNLDISAYEMVLIIFSAINVSTTSHTVTVAIPRAHDGIANHITQARYDSGSYICGRTVTVNFTDGTLVFQAGSQNGTTMNARMIPRYIYGIKGVT